MSSDDASSNKSRRIGESKKTNFDGYRGVTIHTATGKHFDKTNTIDISQNLAVSE